MWLVKNKTLNSISHVLENKITQLFAMFNWWLYRPKYNCICQWANVAL